MQATVVVVVTDAPAAMVAPRVLIVGKDGTLTRVPSGASLPEYEPRRMTSWG